MMTPRAEAAAMGWMAVAALLSEREVRPLFLLDRAGRIRLANTAAERMLGVRPGALLARTWEDLGPPPGPTDPGWIAEALRGLVRRHDCTLATQDGGFLTVSLAVSAIGAEPETLVLATVEAVRAQEGSPQERLLAHDFVFEISAELGSFGLLQRLYCLAGTELSVGHLVGQHCFTVMRKRSAVCPECPLLAPSEVPWPRYGVWRAPHRPHAYQVITATPIGRISARIAIRFVDDAAMTALLEARLRELGARAHLSEREQAVLSYMAMGRTPTDIATILGIKSRTVKFHQANVLAKLGAESRADLIRLIF